MIMDWMPSRVTLGSLAAINGLMLKIVEQNDAYAVSVRGSVIAKGRTLDLPDFASMIEVDHGDPALNRSAITYTSLVCMTKQIRAHVTDELGLTIMADVSRDHACVSVQGEMTVTLPIPLSVVWSSVIDLYRGRPVTLFSDVASQLIADYARICHFRWRGLGDEEDQGALRDILQGSVRGLRIGVATDPDGLIVSVADSDQLTVQYHLDRVALLNREDVYWAGVIERLILAYGRERYWRD